MKQKLIIAYLLIGLCYALYKTFFSHSMHGFLYHLGGGMVWPLVMFPALGKIVAGIIIVLVIIVIMSRK